MADEKTTITTTTGQVEGQQTAPFRAFSVNLRSAIGSNRRNATWIGAGGRRASIPVTLVSHMPSHCFSWQCDR